MASGLVSRRAVEAEVLLVVVANAALATTAVPEPTVPLAVLSVPAALVLDDVGADDEEDEEGDGLGHAFLYTNCSGGPLQVVAAPAS